MKKILFFLFVLALLAVNVQWHYDRMCAAVFSPHAYFKADGVYCEVGLQGVEFKLSELLERHARIQAVEECKIANPGREARCDPRFIPPSDTGSG